MAGQKKMSFPNFNVFLLSKKSFTLYSFTVSVTTRLI